MDWCASNDLVMSNLFFILGKTQPHSVLFFNEFIIEDFLFSNILINNSISWFDHNYDVFFYFIWLDHTNYISTFIDYETFFAWNSEIYMEFKDLEGYYDKKDEFWSDHLEFNYWFDFQYISKIYKLPNLKIYSVFKESTFSNFNFFYINLLSDFYVIIIKIDLVYFYVNDFLKLYNFEYLLNGFFVKYLNLGGQELEFIYFTYFENKIPHFFFKNFPTKETFGFAEPLYSIYDININNSIWLNSCKYTTTLNKIILNSIILFINIILLLLFCCCSYFIFMYISFFLGLISDIRLRDITNNLFSVRFRKFLIVRFFTFEVLWNQFTANQKKVKQNNLGINVFLWPL